MLDQSTTKPSPRDRRAERAAYYAAHREQWRLNGSTYRAAHREERNAVTAAWRSAHRQEILAQRRGYDAAYCASHRDEQAAYRASHREEIAAYHAAHSAEAAGRNHARRARLRGVPSERVLISVLFERDKGICGICKKRVYKQARDLWMRPSHDHILPVSHGGANTYLNARLAHRRCNIARGNRGAAQLRMVAANGTA